MVPEDIPVTLEDALAENARLRDENRTLRKRLDEIELLVERTRRAGKRQAAPFSKGTVKAEPKPPGRKPGPDYGKAGHRQAPDHVEESFRVELPPTCECGGCLTLERTAVQFQEELPEPRPQVSRFVVEIGRCQQCGRRVQTRHPRQTSDALGAASAQIGPRAQAVSSWLMKRMGLSAAKASEVMSQVAGITVTPGGLVHAAQRLGERTEPADAELREQVRQSEMVSPDETGWRIGGRNAWLWTAVTAETTIYRIEHSRGSDVVKELLGEKYSGIVVRDGWAPYRQLTEAEHQTCTAHLLRRCNEILETARGRAREIPRAVKNILLEALEVRDRRDRGELSDREVRRQVELLDERMDALLARPAITRPANRTLLKHLRNERAALFTFLRHRGIDATNWRAEQAIRPAVVNRKVWGGNRTRRGAHTQEILMSVMQTCRQRRADVIVFLEQAQRRAPGAPPSLVPILSG